MSIKPVYLLIHGGAPVSIHDSAREAYGEAEAIADVDEFSLLRLPGAEYIELPRPENGEDDDATYKIRRHARYIIVLDRMDDDDHCADGHEPASDMEGMAQVAAELQEAMEQTGEPAGFFNVIARYRVPSGNTNVAEDDPSRLRKSVRKALDDGYDEE